MTRISLKQLTQFAAALAAGSMTHSAVLSALGGDDDLMDQVLSIAAGGVVGGIAADVAGEVFDVVDDVAEDLFGWM